MVVKLVEKYGPKRWSLIASQLKGRIGKQCRERLILPPVPYDSTVYHLIINANIAIIISNYIYHHMPLQCFCLLYYCF